MKTIFLTLTTASLCALMVSCKKETNPEPVISPPSTIVSDTTDDSLSLGLLFSYNFTGNIADASINANHLGSTSANYVYTTDRNNQANKAVRFSGNGKLVLPSNSSYKVQFPFTVSMWVNVEDSSSVNNRFIWSDGSAMYNGFFISTDPNTTAGKVACSFGDGTGIGSGSRYSAYSSLGIRSNLWQHVLVIYKSATEIIIYINGVKDTNVTYTGYALGIAHTSAPGEIGHIPTYSSYYFSGKMDKIRMWNRELTNAEVNQEYNSTF